MIETYADIRVRYAETDQMGEVWGIGVSLVLCFIKLMSLHRRGQKMLEGPVWPRF